MAEDKSFKLYKDLGSKLKNLTREEKGAIFEAIFAYKNSEEIPKDMPIGAAIAWDFVLPMLQAAEEKYAELSDARAEAGRKGMAKRWQNNKAITNDNKPITNDNKSITSYNNVITSSNNSITKDKSIKNKDMTNVIYAVSNPVQEKLNEYFGFLEQLDQKPLSLKARQVIAQKLVSITDIETKQIQLIEKAMSNGWRNVYEREETPAESAKNGQQGDITDLDAWLNKMASEELA